MAELQEVEAVAGKEGQDAVEASDFVDGKGEGDEFGSGSEGDDAEEGLPHLHVSTSLMTL